MGPFKTLSRETLGDITTDLEKAGVAYTSEEIQHEGAATGETRKIVYTSPNTGETVYVKARYDMIAADAVIENLEYYNGDFTIELTQYQANQVGNACCLADNRLTAWEREFVQSLMDRRLLDNVNLLSPKQHEKLAGIAKKVSDVPGI